MKTVKLNEHPRWPLYKKVRRTIQRELAATGAPASDSAVDEFLRDRLPELAAELVELFRVDQEARAAQDSAQPRS